MSDEDKVRNGILEIAASHITSNWGEPLEHLEFPDEWLDNWEGTVGKLAKSVAKEIRALKRPA